MKDFKAKYGDWALLLGAAAGIGAAYAELLASMGMNLLVLDNKEEALGKLSKDLTSRHAIEVKEIVGDLENDSLLRVIEKEVINTSCRLLIYNAAYSIIQPFVQHSTADLNRYIKVNIDAPLKLTHLFSSILIKNKQSGGILLMSSLAGLLGMQLVAPYAATKAFTWNLAEGLYHELRPHKIDVCACVAGATLSETYINTNPKYGWMKPPLQEPTDVAQNAINQLGKKAFFISGFGNKVNYFILTRLLPRKMAARLANKVMSEMYGHSQ